MAPRKLHGKHSQLPLNFHTKCWISLSFHGAQGDMIVVFPSPLVFGWHFSLTPSGTVSRKEPSKWLSMRLASSGSADSCLSLGGRYNWMCQQNSLPGYCIQYLFTCLHTVQSIEIWFSEIWGAKVWKRLFNLMWHCSSLHFASRMRYLERTSQLINAHNN